MAFSIKNSIRDIMPGFGTSGNDGGSSVYVTGTANGVATTVATATATSAGTCNKGYVHVSLYGGASSAILTSLSITVTDGTTIIYIYGAAFTSITANQGFNISVPFSVDLAVNKASVTFISSAGTFNVDIELAGNLGPAPSGTSQL